MPRILVCDNEDSLRDLVVASLAGRGYDFVEAADGDEALEAARRVRPDLIVLDVMMPERTGFDVLAELRRDPELKAVKVVIVTARARPADRAKAADAGADGFLSKPFSPGELAETVADLLAR